MTIQQENIDCLARESHTPGRHCTACHRAMSLYDQLVGKCPKCGALVLEGPGEGPGEARKMLARLRARRRELGLGYCLSAQPYGSAVTIYYTAQFSHS